MYSIVHCITVQYNTVQHSAAQYSTVLYSTVQYSAYSTVVISDRMHRLPKLLDWLYVRSLICATRILAGGWSFGTQKFKVMSATRYARQTFIYSAIPFLRDRQFDGLDVDWEYPKGSDDKKNFVLLLKGTCVWLRETHWGLWFCSVT